MISIGHGYAVPLVVCVLLLTHVEPANGGTPQLEVQLPARNPVVGKQFLLKLSVAWQGDAGKYVLFPPNSPELDGLALTHRSTSASRTEDTTLVTFELLLRIDKPGEFILGELVVPYKVAGAEDQQLLRSPPVTIAVRANPLPTQIVITVGMLGCATGMILLSRRILRSRRKEREEIRHVEDRLRQQELMEELENLKSLRIAGNLGEYLMKLTDTAAKCGPAVCKSTQHKKLKNLAEKTKFSGHYPTVEELDSSYRTVARWIRQYGRQCETDKADAGAANT